jgi:hypothetical protein
VFSSSSSFIDRSVRRNLFRFPLLLQIPLWSRTLTLRLQAKETPENIPPVG